MKPAAFRYAAPQSLDEALALLSVHGEEAKLLAGGQSLVPLLHLRLARPQVLVDLNRIPAAAGIEVAEGQLRLGFLARQRSAERSPIVQGALPLLAEAIAEIGHAQIRSRGTLAGSAAHADPAAEIPAVLLALDGELIAQSRQGGRSIAARDFFQGYFQTALRPDEVVTELRLPLPPAGSGQAFLEFSRRRGDFALAGVAVLVELSQDGNVRSARVALSGVAGGPVRAEAAEAHLGGRRFDAAAAREAARLAAADLDPPDDAQASSDYRRELARTLIERALARAAERAQRGVA